MKKCIVALLTFLIIVSFCFVGFLFYKELKDCKVPKTDASVEYVIINDKYVDYVTNAFDSVYDYDLRGYFFNNTELSSKIKLYMTVDYLIGDNIYFWTDGLKIFYDCERILELAKDIFGDDTTLEFQDISVNAIPFSYDATSNDLTAAHRGGRGGGYEDAVFSEIISKEFNSNIYSVTVSKLYVKYYQGENDCSYVYDDYVNGKMIGEVCDYDFSDYVDKGKKVVFNFKVADGKTYLYSVNN